jgi:hypothetical protein
MNGGCITAPVTMEAKRKIQKRNERTEPQAVYASGTIDFFRWKILRVRDLLRGFLSFSPLAIRPRERELASASAMYLSL